MKPGSEHKRRLGIGALLGVVCVAFAILLGERGLVVQVTVWSLIVGAIVLCENYQHFRERWFWRAWLLALAVHSAVLAIFWHDLPFPDLGVAILMSFAEAVLLLILFRAMASAQ